MKIKIPATQTIEVPPHLQSTKYKESSKKQSRSCKHFNYENATEDWITYSNQNKAKVFENFPIHTKTNSAPNTKGTANVQHSNQSKHLNKLDTRTIVLDRLPYSMELKTSTVRRAAQCPTSPTKGQTFGAQFDFERRPLTALLRSRSSVSVGWQGAGSSKKVEQRHVVKPKSVTLGVRPEFDSIRSHEHGELHETTVPLASDVANVPNSPTHFNQQQNYGEDRENQLFENDGDANIREIRKGSKFSFNKSNGMPHQYSKIMNSVRNPPTLAKLVVRILDFYRASMYMCLI